MSGKKSLSRRHFLQAGLLATAGVALAPWQPALAQALPSSAIDTTPNDVATHGSQVNGLNTGVLAGYDLTHVTSSIVVSEAWIKNVNAGRRAIENKHFLADASLTVMVDDFTVRSCKFSGKSRFIRQPDRTGHQGGANVSIVDCEFDGCHENPAGAAAIYGVNLILKRVHVHRWPRAVWLEGGDIWVEQCYMHDLTAHAGQACLENIYVAAGVNQTYLRNKLIANEIGVAGEGKRICCAALTLSHESLAGAARIEIRDNDFQSDGYYAVYAGACAGRPAGYTGRTVFQGNIFSHEWQAKMGFFVPVVGFDASRPGNLWLNNTWGAPEGGWQDADTQAGTRISEPAACTGYFAGPAAVVADCVVKHATLQAPCQVIALGCCAR